MKYSLAIFDLDGTILNTLVDLTTAVNHALKSSGYAHRTMDEVRRFIGNGASRLIRLCLPADVKEPEHAAVLAEFKRYYSEHINTCTVPYEGVSSLLHALKASGITLAVNSNKPDDGVKTLCKAHFDGLFSLAVGQREGVPKKPAPDGALAIINALGASPDHVLYIGDGDTDIMTAQNAGIDAAWVSWGFRDRKDLTGLDIPLIFDTPQSLQDYLLGQ